MDWLTVAASKAGQEAFNPLKGSICARTDCDQSLFSEYSQNAAKDWASNKVVGSLTHEVVGNPSWDSKVATALGVFVGSPDQGGRLPVGACCRLQIRRRLQVASGESILEKNGRLLRSRPFWG